MSEPVDDQIKKVQISDVQSAADETSTELDDSQLEKVSGGGTYGCPVCGLGTCACDA